MSSINNNSLEITVYLPAGQAKVVIEGEVRFTTYDLNQIADGVSYELTGTMREVDSPDPDDHLFSFDQPIRYSRITDPQRVNRFRFEKLVSLNELDSDNGDDEVYGRLRLKNLETGNVVDSDNTDTITFNFNYDS